MAKGNKKQKSKSRHDENDSDNDTLDVDEEKVVVKLKDLDFAQRRELQRKAAAEKRKAKQRCYLCGKTGHVRRECPGIADDGRGESKYTKSKGDSGATQLKASSKGARNRGRKQDKNNNASSDTVKLPFGFSATQQEEQDVDPFVYYDAGSDASATLDYLRTGRGKNKLAMREAISEYKHALDTASTTSNFGGMISRSIIKPDHPWTPESALDRDDVFFVVGLGAARGNGDGPGSGFVNHVVETVLGNDRIVGLFCDLDLSPTTTSRSGFDAESQLHLVRCSCEIAGKTNVAIQIRALPSAANDDSDDSSDSPYAELMMNLHRIVHDAITEYPSLKIHLSRWVGNSDHMYKLLTKYPNNVWIGMDGTVTFAKAKHAHECAFDVPLSKLVLETGSPSTIPSKVSRAKGRQAFCHSGLIPFVAEAIAKYKTSPSLEITAEQVARAASDNTLILYPQLHR